MRRTTRFRVCCYTVIVAVGTGLVTISTANAASGNQRHKFIASDPGPNERFGEDVAISGNLALVGARWHDDPFNLAGGAFLYDLSTGNELLELTPPLAEPPFIYFGQSVTVGKNSVVVGGSAQNDIGVLTGAAFVYDLPTGTFRHKLTPSDGASGDSFSFSAAAWGNTAIIGSNQDDDAGNASGSAYLFDLTSGNELFKLTASDADAEDQFGYSVAIDNTTAIVGSPFNDDTGSNSGSAYLYDTTTGNELFKLTPSDAAAGDSFGWSVAVSGNLALIGSLGDDDDGSLSGSAYVFDVTTGQELFKLTASDAAAGDRFGASVALSGNHAIIGAFAHDLEDLDEGAAYVFDLTTMTEVFKLIPSDSGANDQFGNAVAIDGNNAIVGAWKNDDDGTNSGSAYVFDVSPPINGDLDGDGFVGIDDLSIVLSNWNQNVVPGIWRVGDPSGDGFVGIDDLGVVLGNWNAGALPPPAAARIPEPTSASMLVLLCVATLRHRTRERG